MPNWIPEAATPRNTTEFPPGSRCSQCYSGDKAGVVVKAPETAALDIISSESGDGYGDILQVGFPLGGGNNDFFQHLRIGSLGAAAEQCRHGDSKGFFPYRRLLRLSFVMFDIMITLLPSDYIKSVIQ